MVEVQSHRWISAKRFTSDTVYFTPPVSFLPTIRKFCETRFESKLSTYTLFSPQNFALVTRVLFTKNPTPIQYFLLRNKIASEYARMKLHYYTSFSERTPNSRFRFGVLSINGVYYRSFSIILSEKSV